MKKKRWLAGMLAAAFLCWGTGGVMAEAAGMAVPKDIYQWVQSTARAGYYFNRQQMGYAVREDGTIDLNTLIVPTIKLYDAVQIQDVVSKRRWKMLDCRGYDDLVGAADYLRFDLSAHTVQVTRHDDLDSKWGTLSTEKGGGAIPLERYAEKDVDGIFYRAILAYAAEHRDDFIARSRGTLSESDAARLEKERQEQLEAEKKALEEQKKAEKEREKQRRREQRKQHKK